MGVVGYPPPVILRNEIDPWMPRTVAFFLLFFFSLFYFFFFFLPFFSLNSQGNSVRGYVQKGKKKKKKEIVNEGNMEEILGFEY